MQNASAALAASDRSGALTAQDLAIGTLQQRQEQLTRIREQAASLGQSFESVHQILGSGDVRQVEALNTLEQALRNPAWQILNEPLSDSARAQVRHLHNRLQDAYRALGGTSVIPLADMQHPGMTNVVKWATFTLPPHLRQELLDGLRETGPAAYQHILEEYYRSISTEP